MLSGSSRTKIAKCQRGRQIGGYPQTQRLRVVGKALVQGAECIDPRQNEKVRRRRSLVSQREIAGDPKQLHRNRIGKSGGERKEILTKQKAIQEDIDHVKRTGFRLRAINSTAPRSIISRFFESDYKFVTRLFSFVMIPKRNFRLYQGPLLLYNDGTAKGTGRIPRLTPFAEALIQELFMSFRPIKKTQISLLKAAGNLSIKAKKPG